MFRSPGVVKNFIKHFSLPPNKIDPYNYCPHCPTPIQLAIRPVRMFETVTRQIRFKIDVAQHTAASPMEYRVSPKYRNPKLPRLASHVFPSSKNHPTPSRKETEGSTVVTKGGPATVTRSALVVFVCSAGFLLSFAFVP